MADLKQLKNRIKSVKSTQKITKAMKMVAAAKLRRAKENAEAARPYAEAMAEMLSTLAAGSADAGNAPALLAGNGPVDGRPETHLLIVATSDRGLCGGFNSSIARAVRKKVEALQGQGKVVQLFFIGRKGYDQLRLDFADLEVGRLFDATKGKMNYGDAEAIAKQVIAPFEAQEIDQVHIVYNHFKNAISQIVTFQQLIPLPAAEGDSAPGIQDSEKTTASAESRIQNPESAPYEYEPEEEVVLSTLLPKNVGVQIFKALLENAASEQGARMTAMDNATRNAGEMIKKLTLVYNRTRQAVITKELIEIISGAEAV